MTKPKPPRVPLLSRGITLPPEVRQVSGIVEQVIVDLGTVGIACWTGNQTVAHRLLVRASEALAGASRALAIAAERLGPKG